MTPDPFLDSPSPDGTNGGVAPFQQRLHGALVGPNGIRAGWRLLIAICLFFAIAIALVRIPSVRARLLPQNQGAIVITPVTLFFTEGVPALAALLTALVMTRIEKRSFADYGLPGNAAFGKRFWQGIVYGFIMVSLMMGLIAALHGFSPGGFALGGGTALRYALLYLLGFILVAFFEEFSFRGYLQATLASGIGFWPAAALLAVVFGASHLSNPGEAKFGAFTVASFGLLCAFILRRTGSIWFAIGMHCAWDWGETFFYSVPDSGVLAKGHLMNPSFHGPTWLTGGSVGPEGSVFAFVVLVLSAAAIHFMFPAKSVADSAPFA
jgi:membrane protease YdiL (CAAX protease family)